MKLFKNRTFDKEAFIRFIGGCCAVLFSVGLIVLCVCFEWFGYIMAGILFGAIPLMMFCIAVWSTFNKIFPLKEEEDDKEDEY